MIWISAVTGFSVPEIPHIKSATFAEMKHISYDCDNVVPATKKVCADTSVGYKTLALYIESSETIYISNDFWWPSKKDQSILLHELVHHMQFANNYQKTTESCGRPDLEAQAYSVQSEWLKTHGMSLEKDIGIGPLYLYIITTCIPPRFYKD